MSTNTSIVYGYGFECQPTQEQLLNFIKLHKETFYSLGTDEQEFCKEVFSGELTDEEFDDFFENCECNISGQKGYGAEVSNIMQKERDISFEFQRGQGDCMGSPSVMVVSGLPWSYTEKEKCLTEDELCNICQKYMNELGIEGEPDYLSIEYYG